jgi:hypothetical protein
VRLRSLDQELRANQLGITRDQPKLSSPAVGYGPALHPAAQWHLPWNSMDRYSEEEVYFAFAAWWLPPLSRMSVL